MKSTKWFARLEEMFEEEDIGNTLTIVALRSGEVLLARPDKCTTADAHAMLAEAQEALDFPAVSTAR